MSSPSGLTPTCAPNARPVEQAAGPVGLGALDLYLERGPGQELGDRSLPDDLALVHDGHRVAGALHLVEQVRRQHHGAPLGDERVDHVAHLEHAAGIEPVHRFVEDQQLGVTEEAGRDAEPLAHPHGVLRHLVVGAVQDADAFERRRNAALGRRFTRRGEDLQVLPAGQVAVETGLVDDGAHPGQRQVAMAGHGVAEQRHRPGVGVGQPEQDPDQGRLAGAVRSEIPEGAAPGNQELHAVDGDIVPEPLRQAVRLDGPRPTVTAAALGTATSAASHRDVGDRGHARPLYRVCTIYTEYVRSDGANPAGHPHFFSTG